MLKIECLSVAMCSLAITLCLHNFLSASLHVTTIAVNHSLADIVPSFKMVPCQLVSHVAYCCTQSINSNGNIWESNINKYWCSPPEHWNTLISLLGFLYSHVRRDSSPRNT